MSAGQRLRRGFEAAALTLAIVASVPALARDNLRNVPIASVMPLPDGRNVSDGKAVTVEPARPRPTVERTELSVTVDRAKVIRLPERTQTVIIGNPAVADIAIQKNGVVILTGKSFGVTNFIALDSTGSQLSESMISVSAPNDATVMVQRGMERQTYSCTPVCQPSIALGDAGNYFAETKGQADQHTVAQSQR